MSTVELRIRAVPPELHRSLKLWSVEESITLNDLVIRLLQDAVGSRTRKRQR